MKGLTGAVLLLLCFALLGHAATASPTQAPLPAVSDGADVLDAQLIADLQTFSAEAANKAGVTLRVVTKHFLGGAQPAAYTRDLLASQPGGAGTLLLVLVIGEDAYASAIGSEAAEVVSADAVDTLLASHFRASFLARDYGKALANFALRLSQQIQSATGARLDTTGLFSAYTAAPQASATPAPQATVRPMQDWLDELEDIFRVPTDSANQAEEYDQQTRRAEQQSGDGLGFIPIIVIGYVLFRIFGRRNGRGGCGPLGWIFGTWGASRIFRRRF